MDGSGGGDAVSTPVSDPISGVTYRNVYCADCNGQLLNELAYWRWKYTCPDKGKFSQRLRQWTKTEQPASVVRRRILDHTRSRCQLSYQLPQDTNLQRCFVNLVDDCADNAFNSILYRKQRSRCRDYPFDIVHTRDGKRAFKNRHCATCSLVQKQSLSCWRLGGISFVNHRESFTMGAIFGLGRWHCDERVATPNIESRDAYCEAEAACTGEKMNEDICIINYYIAKSIWASLDEVSPDRTTTIAARPSHMQYDGALSEAAADITTTIAARPSKVLSEFIGDKLIVHNRDGDDSLQSSLVQYRSTSTHIDFTLLSNGSHNVADRPQTLHCPPTGMPGYSATVCLLPSFTAGSSDTAAGSEGGKQSRGCARVLEWLMVVLLLVSEGSLAVYFVLVALVGQLRSFSGKMVINQAAAFFAGFLLFLLQPLADQQPGVCIAVPATAHYCFLVAFSWSLLYAIEIVRALWFERLLGNASCRLAAYLLAGWGMPALIVAAGLAADTDELSLRPSYGSPHCFIGSQEGSREFFIVPLCLLLSFDLAVYFAAVAKLGRLAPVVAPVHRSRGQKLCLCCKLLLNLGCLWLLAVVAAFADEPIAYCLFSAVIYAQGLFVLLIFAGKSSVCSRLLKSVRSITPSSQFRRHLQWMDRGRVPPNDPPMPVLCGGTAP